MLSSYADAGRVAEGLARQDLVVCLRPLPERHRAPLRRRGAAGTAWLEELGCKSTNTHLYLMPKALRAAGRDAPGRLGRCASWRARLGARRTSSRGRARAVRSTRILDHPATGHATVAALRAEGGMRALRISHVAHPGPETSPRRRARSSSSPSARGDLGLPPLPVHEAPAGVAPIRSRCARGARSRTSTASTITAGRCRRWPSADPEPVLWISPADAAARERDGRRGHPHPQRARRAVGARAR